MALALEGLVLALALRGLALALALEGLALALSQPCIYDRSHTNMQLLFFVSIFKIKSRLFTYRIWYIFEWKKLP